jgi:hypothetical protein
MSSAQQQPSIRIQPVIDDQVIAIGTRVRFRDHPFGVRLRSYTGTVVRYDSYSGSCIVRMDEPATQFLAKGRQEDLPEIREASDNLIPLSAGA